MTEELHEVRLHVNGVAHDVAVPARRLLSDALRHDLGLTGTHVGCEHGVCGACTVLVDGRPMRSCLMFAVSAVDSEITTVEGLTIADGSPQGRLGPVQQAFSECHGLQCGFCTPGFLTTITAGLEANPAPSEDEARDMVAGNLCRCTGYQNIVKSVLRAAELRDPVVEEGRSPVTRPGEMSADGSRGLVTGASAPSSTSDPELRDPAVEEGRSPVTRPGEMSAGGSRGLVTGASAPSSTSDQEFEDRTDDNASTGLGG